MKSRCVWRLMIVGTLVLGGILNVGEGNVEAAPPTGVLKQAIHWGISADYLDPATSSGLTPYPTLYIFNDALAKARPA